MKIINTFAFTLIVSLMVQMNLLAQDEVPEYNQFAINAISQAVTQYHQHEFVGYKKCMIITMKIMSINDTSGEFVLLYILTDRNYKDLNPTHYVHVNKELILIKVDSQCKVDPAKYGIIKITEEIKKEALHLLLGPDVAVTGKDAPIMIFNYKKLALKRALFLNEHPPEKYWF